MKKTDKELIDLWAMDDATLSGLENAEYRILFVGARGEEAGNEGCLQAGVHGDTAGAPWYSDAGVFAPVCGETVVFGPGSIAQAHTAGEFIELSELQSGADALRCFFRLLAAPGADSETGGKSGE